MTRETVVNRTKEIIYSCFPDLEKQNIQEDTVINTDESIDSMGFVLVICKLEAEFNVKIPERQWSRLMTLGDVVDAIMKRLPKA
jgi:acyl carrier protein